MKSNNWLNRQKKDKFVKKSKQKGFLSRSAFKLIEVEKKYNLITSSNEIIDIGAAPGGWCQVVLQINSNAKITAIDKLNLKFSHPNINFINNDFTKIDYKYLNKKFDLILSDLAPNTTGHQSTDHLRISNFIYIIIESLNIIANSKSNLVIKIWKGSEEKKITEILKKRYQTISYFKPESSRKKSSEIYIVGQKFIK